MSAVDILAPPAALLDIVRDGFNNNRILDDKAELPPEAWEKLIQKAGTRTGLDQGSLVELVINYEAAGFDKQAEALEAEAEFCRKTAAALREEWDRRMPALS